MRFAAFFLLIGVLGCGGADPFEVDARDPISDRFQPLAPDVLGATLQEDGAVKLTWSDNSDVEDGYLVERRLSSQSEFAEVAVLPPGTTQFTDTPPIAFQATYRVSAFVERAGTRRISETPAERQVVFFDTEAFVPTLYVNDERALHVGFPSDLPAGFTLHVQRYADGQADGPAREVVGPLPVAVLGVWPHTTRSHVFIDSLLLREISYRYEISVDLQGERSRTLATEQQVKLGWEGTPSVWLNAYLAGAGPNNVEYILQTVCTRAPLGTLYTFSLVDETGQVHGTSTFDQTTRPHPQMQPIMTFGSPDNLDRTRRYRLHVRLSSGAEAVSNELYYRGGWRTN